MLKKLKGLFIIEEEDGKEGKQSGPKDNQSKTKSSSAQDHNSKKSAPAAEIPKPTGGQPSERFVNKLLGAIEANNLEGFDYLEFKQALQNLDAVAMDEDTRYKSAFAMAKTMGAEPTQLIKSAEHYIAVLSDEEQKFRVAFDNQQQAKVKQREENQQGYLKGIEDRKKRIEELNAQIQELEEKLAALKQETNQAQAKVDATKSGFYNAYHIVVDQIKADLAIMQRLS